MDRSSLQDARRSPATLCVWFGRLFFRLTATMLAIGAGVSYAATQREGSSADWRADAAFGAANEAIESWLADSPQAGFAVAAWRQACLSTPRASQLGSELLSVGSQADERLASLVSDLPASPPPWLSDLQGAAPSIRLAIAERIAAQERHEACLAWTVEHAEWPSYSPTLRRYLRAVAFKLTVDDEQAAEAIAELASSETLALGAGRQWIVEALRHEVATEAEPLPRVTRRMQDIERRLALTDPGDATQTQQQRVLDELDELIKELDEQQKQQQQSAAAGGGGSVPGGRPAEESRPSELKGPGEIDRKRLVAGDAWGALPPEERARLTQSITRDFPPHYRALIEDYFRTLAAESDETDRDTVERRPE